MGAKTDLFPTFSELCLVARDVEKKPLSVPPRPIDGKLVLDENFGIFPREFDEYTYNFLLFEAQKIERRLSADAIASTQQDSILGARRLTPEQQMQNDLHKFVSAQERTSVDDEESNLLQSLREKKAPALSTPSEVVDYERDNLRPQESSDSDVPTPGDDAAPLPEKAVATPPSAKKIEIPLPPSARPRVMPMALEQKKSSSLPGAPQIPSATPPALPSQQPPPPKPSWQAAAPKPPAPAAQPSQAAKPSWQAAASKPPVQTSQPPLPPKPSLQAAPKIPISKPVEQDIFEAPSPAEPISPPSSAPLPSSGSDAMAEKKPQTSGSSYSKLSPRLQAIIEQKLRREEEKAKKSRADADIFKTPPPPPPEDESEEKDVGQELENMDAPNAWNLHDEDAGGKEEAEKPNARDKEKKTPLPISPRSEEMAPDASSGTDGEESLPAPLEKIQRKMPLRKMDDDLVPMPEEDGGLSPKEDEEAPDNAAPQTMEREEMDEVPAPDEAEPGDLAIKPLARKEKAQVEKSPIKDEMPSDEDGVSDEKEKQIPPPAALEEKETAAPGARREAQSGPITIKPMFPDAATSGPSKEKQNVISQAEDSDRMRRIQRIIEELSPDKVRVQPKQADVSFEKEENEQEPEEEEPPEKPVSAPPKTASAKKSKEPSAPLKKSAKAEKKKAAAAQEQAVPPAKQKAAPAKKLQSNVKSDELSSGADEEVPTASKVAPRIAARVEKTDDEAPAPARLKPRMIAREEEAEEAAPAPARLKPRMIAREEEAEEAAPAPARLKPRMIAREEETEEEAPAKLKPRVPVRAQERAEDAEEAPARPFRKLMPRLPPREEPDEEAPPPASVSPLRRRVLPGMARTAPATPQTYVPPARERKQITTLSDEPEQEAQAEEAEMSPQIAPLKPRKLASDETLPAADKTPEQILQEQKMAKMAEQLARLEAGKVKEVAGTASMPVEDEDIPLPEEGEGVPRPEEYKQAKESLRKELEHEETARKIRQEDEALIEQYAKDHMVWLYEIYKMGGMGRADFLQKASEKYSEMQNAGQAASSAGDAKDAPPNPALAALSKEIEKKDKK
jgi:hypothetical protein